MKILDAVYDIQLSSDQWLDGVLRIALSTLDCGAGAGGVLYDISTDVPLLVENIQGFGISEEWRKAGLAIHQDAAFYPGIVDAYRSLLCATLPELARHPKVTGPLQLRYEDFGFRDEIMINGIDCSGKRLRPVRVFF